ncbi:enoyl-CoA hydratase-related protein, partial [Pseudomonas aeruginosa]
MSADPSPVVLLEFPAADVALLRLNRPQARNALNDEVRQRLASHFQTLGADPAIRVIVLTGDSRCFAAGADLRDLSTSTAIGLYGRHSERYWEAIARCPKPVIAAV